MSPVVGTRPKLKKGRKYWGFDGFMEKSFTDSNYVIILGPKQ
jgi:hypothetical protein